MSDTASIVRDFLGLTVASHKRRCAIRQGRREPITRDCRHEEHWNRDRHWCDACGVTKEELVSGSVR